MVHTHPVHHKGPHRGPARGAASLVVVMILFFVITLVAAYTSRNLLFEQRTSANQYRATLAFETADAGIEWAIARLNEGRMNDDCTELAPATAVTSPPQPSFRERYLNIDPTTGVITTALSAGVARIAGCVFNGVSWVCHCPDSGDPSPTVASFTGNGPFPAFWVRFRSNLVGSRPGVVRIQVNACTRNDPACLNFSREAQSGDGLATVWTMVALRGALPSAPAAALTVRGTFSRDTDSNPTVTNEDPTSGGITIHGGGNIPTAGITLTSIPGTPTQFSVFPDDLGLNDDPVFTAIGYATPANDGRNRMFNSVFGIWPTTYFAQPGVAVVNCGGGCDADAVNAVVARQPGHAIYVNGGGTLNIDANIGTASAPVLLIVDGDVEFSGTPTVYGVVYSRDSTWQLQGNGTIRGAAIAERDFRFEDDDPTIIYDRSVILSLQHRAGSFVRVAGSWRDFQPGVNP